MNRHSSYPGYIPGPLSAVVAEYIEHKRAAGNEYISEEEHYRRLDTFAGQFGCPKDKLTKEVVLAWIQKKPHEKSLTQSKRIDAVKRFASFLRERGYEAYVYPYASERPSEPYIPHIFTESEMCLLIRLADQYQSATVSPCLGLTVSLVFRLLYGCGLRTSEVLNLRICDVDAATRTLRISGAKFGKSRIVPMSSNLCERCVEYIQATRTTTHTDSDFLLHRKQRGVRYSDSVIYYWFRNLLSGAGIPHGGKGVGPRVHDIRHTFAVHRLKMWVSEGKDLRAMLPILSAYMGHCDLRGTQTYLRLTPDLFPDIAKTMGDFFSGTGEEDAQ